MTSVFPVPAELAASAWIDERKYEALYEASLANPDAFWRAQAKLLTWIKPFTTVKNASFAGDVSISWFEDGALNVTANCIDRHLPARAGQTAIIWEGDSPPSNATSLMPNCTPKFAASPMC